MEIFPIYIMSLYRMSDKDLKKKIPISDVVFKDLEESLMIFGESSKIVIFMNVVQEVGQPLLDIHSGGIQVLQTHQCRCSGHVRDNQRSSR